MALKNWKGVRERRRVSSSEKKEGDEESRSELTESLLESGIFESLGEKTTAVGTPSGEVEEEDDVVT